MKIKSYIKTITEGNRLDDKKSEELFDAIFSGSVSEVELSALLIAMKIRKETPDEIVGAAISMRKFSEKPDIKDDNLFDTCGTGGDNSHSFNISSAVAIILNTLGVPIAKHGNRSVSSKSGSADFYEALKIPLSLKGADVSKYFKRNNFIFLFAPNYHPAMKFAAPVRKALGVRTIFNMLGPLTNPTAPKRQMIGIFHPEFLPLYSEAALKLPYEKIILYSGSSGMDEVSPFEPTLVYESNGKNMKQFAIHPDQYISTDEASKLPRDLTAEENAALFLETIQTGQPTPLGKLLALNTALALYTITDGSELKENYKRALDIIHSQAVYRKLMCLQEPVV